MNELDLVKLWNQKRQQIIFAQVAPTLILGTLLALAATGSISKSSPSNLKILALVVVIGSGALSILNQIAVIREGYKVSEALKKLPESSVLGQSVASTEYLLSWSAVAVIGTGVINLGALLLFLYK